MTVRRPIGDVVAEVSRIFEAAGVPAGPAGRTARLLVATEVWGIRSHGLIRIPYYVRRLLDGGTNSNPAFRVLRESAGTVVYDGDAGMGHWQLWDAAVAATARAEEAGVGVAAVTNSGHCGSLGLYTFPATDAGLVGLVFSNGPAVMPPVGGHRAVFSTSPIAAGIPIGGGAAVVDLALSAVARGRVLTAAARGESLDDGWAFDADGVPTNDAQAAIAGMLAPAGGTKGFALAFLVEALTGALVGPNLSSGVADVLAAEDTAKPQGIGHLVLVLNPTFVDGNGASGERFERLAREVDEAGGRVPGIGRPHPDRLDKGASIALEEESVAAMRSAERAVAAAGRATS